jgi:hypothetical protein
VQLLTGDSRDLVTKKRVLLSIAAAVLQRFLRGRGNSVSH